MAATLSFLPLFFVVIEVAQAAAAGVRTFDILPSMHDWRKLTVGTELFGEKLDLQRGQCIYVLEGLELPKSYEVKISYPASIPASFTIDLLKGGPLQAIRGGRRLLNTEKLMFRADESQGAEVLNGMLSARVLVTVEPAGVLTKPYTRDQPFVIFNIMCEEVKFGIPRQAWLMGLLGAAAVLIAALAVMLLPPQLLPRKSNDQQTKKPT